MKYIPRGSGICNAGGLTYAAQGSASEGEESLRGSDGMSENSFVNGVRRFKDD